MSPSEPFALYVAHVEGRTVPRYGHPGQYIGTELQQPNGWKPTGLVVALSHQEVARYNAEYTRHIAQGDLKRCTAEDFARSNDEHAKRAKAAHAERQAAAAPAPSDETTTEGDAPTPDTKKKSASSR